ncbi:hypothetical protein AB0G02_29750 [Actinosynnema sp. NPDC023658]|uniref:hypothetical protein n=1 Tax=Actinosynnema sp. NPDC023658 TaxID=3155465 RepID=UPI0033FA2939
MIRHSAAAYRDPTASFDHVAQSPGRPGAVVAADEADVAAAPDTTDAASDAADTTATNTNDRFRIRIAISPYP